MLCQRSVGAPLVLRWSVGALCFVEAFENVFTYRRQFSECIEKRCGRRHFVTPVGAFDDMRERFVRRAPSGPETLVCLEINRNRLSRHNACIHAWLCVCNELLSDVLRPVAG